MHFESSRPGSRLARRGVAVLVALGAGGPALPVAIALALSAGARRAAAQAEPPAREWAGVDEALGRTGKPQPGGVRKYGFLRSDLRVRCDGVELEPAFALGSWIAFEARGRDTVAMGDLVLTDSEVTPVLTRLEDEGIQVTALHNHLLRETPRVMYLHFEAHGGAGEIGRALHGALALTGTPLGSPAAPAAGGATIDTGEVRAALGYGGSLNGRVYQISIPRADPVREDMAVPPAMGVASGINFQPAGRGGVAVTGDLVLVSDEVNPVIRALRQGGIEVTAVHSHMLSEEPRLFFVHYWGRGEMATLAAALHDAIRHMRVAPPTL